MKELKVGDYVRINTKDKYTYTTEGSTGHIVEIIKDRCYIDFDHMARRYCGGDDTKDWDIYIKDVELIENPKTKNSIKNSIKKETTMNEQIIALFPKDTAKAALVNKHFKNTFDNNPLLGISLTGKEKEVYEAAVAKESTK